jgi:hypothetical protein
MAIRIPQRQTQRQFGLARINRIAARGFEVRGSRFSELRTQNFELRVAPFSPVSLVSHVALYTPRPLPLVVDFST